MSNVPRPRRFETRSTTRVSADRILRLPATRSRSGGYDFWLNVEQPASRELPWHGLPFIFYGTRSVQQRGDARPRRVRPLKRGSRPGQTAGQECVRDRHYSCSVCIALLPCRSLSSPSAGYRSLPARGSHTGMQRFENRRRKDMRSRPVPAPVLFHHSTLIEAI